ncbi:MAG: hypothetical protein NC548_52935, partial [Lachnospiraceae bacterium]|nr:hypothetical protein [Lachnospiraceae bacterium]
PLEIRFYKNKGDILRRIAQTTNIPVLLELPERKSLDGARNFKHPTYSFGCISTIHTTDKEKFQKIAASLPDYRVGYFSMETQNHPFFKFKDFPKGCEDFSSIEDCDYISFRNRVFDCFGNYEESLTNSLMEVFQPGKDKYLLDTVNICLYIQAVDGTGNSVIRLAPVDIREYSIYSELVKEIHRAAGKNGFTGFNCEYVVSGPDRCSLVVFIEDKEDRWDGGRYQFNLHISLYQMPGTAQYPTEGRIICKNDNTDLYALDTIILNGDKCDSLADFSKWADSFFFGYRVD